MRVLRVELVEATPPRRKPRASPIPGSRAARAARSAPGRESHDEKLGRDARAARYRVHDPGRPAPESVAARVARVDHRDVRRGSPGDEFALGGDGDTTAAAAPEHRREHVALLPVLGRERRECDGEPSNALRPGVAFHRSAASGVRRPISAPRPPLHGCRSTASSLGSSAPPLPDASR